jgi:hypothetical protein
MITYSESFMLFHRGNKISWDQDTEIETGVIPHIRVHSEILCSASPTFNDAFQLFDQVKEPIEVPIFRKHNPKIRYRISARDDRGSVIWKQMEMDVSATTRIHIRFTHLISSLS